MLIKVVAVQSNLGEELSLDEKLFIFKQRPDFVCFPEYFMINETMSDYSRAALNIKDNLEYIRSLSESFSTCLIGGSVVEAESDSLFNSSYIFNKGIKLGKYRKLNPVDGEIRKGILPGDKLLTVDVGGIRIAVLICADALNINMFETIGNENIDLIFIPTTSPYREGESEKIKHRRDNDIFLKGAQKASSYVIKTCGVGTLFNKQLQGRSLIVAPWEIKKRVDIYSESSKCILTATLDIDEIREFRKHRQLKEIVKS